MLDSGQRVPEASTGPNHESVGSEAVSGVAWVGATKAFRHGLQYLFQIVLARLLFPDDFGLFGKVLIFTELGVFLNELGLSAALVQRRELDPDDTGSAFWGGVGFSVFSFGLIWALAGPIAVFFENDDLRRLVPIGALTFVFASIGTVPTALLTRELRFRSLFWPEVGGVLVGSVVAVGMAVAGWGAESLVWGRVVTAGGASVFALVAARWFPRWSFDWSRLLRLLSFGGYVVGQRALDYGANSAVAVLVAKFLTERDFGIYTLVVPLARLPQLAFSSVLGRVAFSAFSRIQDENQRIRSAFLLMTRCTVLLSAPALVAVSALAMDFTGGVYGPKWADAATPLALLCLWGLINASIGQPGVVWLAKGRAKLHFYWAYVTGFTMVLAVAVGLKWGLVGACVALVIRSLALFPAPPMFTERVVGLCPREYYRNLFPYLASAAVMWFALAYLRDLSVVLSWQPDWFHLPPDLVRFLVLSIAGFAVYALVLLILRPKAWGEVLEIAKRVRQK